MHEQDVVRDVMRIKRFTQAEVAERAGLKGSNNIRSMFSSKHMRVDNLLLLLNAMDCDLVVRSRTEEASLENPGTYYKPEWIITQADEAEFTKEAHRPTKGVPRSEWSKIAEKTKKASTGRREKE